MGLRSGAEHFAVFLLGLTLANVAAAAICFAVAVGVRSLGLVTLYAPLIFVYNIMVRPAPWTPAQRHATVQRKFADVLGVAPRRRPCSLGVCC